MPNTFYANVNIILIMIIKNDSMYINMVYKYMTQLLALINIIVQVLLTHT